MPRAHIRKWSIALAAGLLATCAAQAQFTFTHVGSGATGDLTTNDAASGSYTLNGGGNDIWSASDNFDFAHYPVSGDFDVKVRVDSLEATAPWTKAGIMAREFMVPASRMAFVRCSPLNVPSTAGGNGVNDVKFMYRTGVTAASQGEHEEGSGQPLYPACWMRLIRSGAVFSSFLSHDGTNWAALSSSDSAAWEGGAMPAGLELGLAVSRHSGSDAIATCEFRDFGRTPVYFATVPVSRTVSVGFPATFSASVNLSTPLTYQWLENGTPIPGATAATYQKTGTVLVDSGKTYSVLVSNRLNGFTAVSPAATLTVVINPQIASTATKGDPNGIYVTFSRVMDNSTTLNSANYTVDNGISVSSVAFWGTGNTTVRLQVSPALTFGTTYTVTVNNVQDSEGNVIIPNPAASSALHGANMAGPARLVFKRFDNVTGGAVSDLTGNSKFPCSPDFTDMAFPTLDYVSAPSGDGIENYGAWAYGIFSPSVSGNYKFAISSDDASQLFLSTDPSPASKALISSQSGYNDRYTYGGRITGDIYLEAGRNYYMEALHKEGCCGDHLTVAMQTPSGGAITNGQTGIEAVNFAQKYSYGCPPTAFFNNLGPVAVTYGPSNQTVTEFSTAKFVIELDGSGPYAVQWYKGSTPIPGATSQTLSVSGYMSNNAATFFAVANNEFSSITSSVATLTVSPAVQVLSASSRNDATGVYVQFNKVMNAAAADPAKYTVSGATISGASLWAPDTVRLTVTSLAAGSHTVTVQNLQSAAGEPLVPNPTTTSFAHLTGTFSADFSSLPAGATIYGSASIAEGYLKLTTAANDQNSAFLLNDFSGGTPISHFHVTWNALVRSSGTPADGYSFNVANDLPSGTYGSPEEGVGSGLSISFDTYNNGNSEAPAIDIRVAGQTLTHYSYQVATGGWVPVVLDIAPDGRLYLIYNNLVVATNLQTNLRPISGVKWGFGARTGGANEDAWIDDLSIVAFTPGAMSLALQPAETTVNERDVVTWSVSVDGSGPYTYQWFSNSVAIAGATTPILSFTALRFADAAVYGVTISNGFSRVQTTNWTLHVTTDLVLPVVSAKAVGSASLREVTLTFSEPVNTVSGVAAANYVITNSAGTPLNVLSARLISNTQVVLTTDPQTTGERYTVVVNNVGDRAGVPNLVAANSAAAFTAWVLTPGFTRMEVYPTGGGTTVPLLRNHSSYPYFPREVYYINSFDSLEAYPNDSHSDYGGRISGVFIAPTNGNYTFYIANDDDAEAYIGSNGVGDNKSVLVSAGCCGTWNTHSAVVSLNAGDQRYIEVLWKEAGGGDYGRLSIDAVNAIGRSMVGVYANPDDAKIHVVQAPVSRTSSPNQFVTYSINATNDSNLPQLYTWQRWDASASAWTNFPNVLGTNKSITIGPLAADLSDNGAQFRVLVYAPGSSVTNTASLTVVNDTVKPTLLSARADGTLNNIYLTFSEPMDGTSGLYEPLSYLLWDEDPSHIYYIASATILSPTNVLLTIDAGGQQMLEGTLYTVSADAIKDANGNEIDITANTAQFTSWVRSRGFVKFDFYTGIGGGTIANLLSASKYPNSPDTSFYTNTTVWPQSNPDLSDYGLRMSGFFVPPVSGDYRFYMKYDDDARFRLSTDENPANLVTVIDVGCCNGGWSAEATVAGLVAGKAYYFEAFVKEAGGGDYLSVGFKQPGSLVIQPIAGASAMIPLPTTVAPNAGISLQPQSVTITEGTTASFSVAVTNTGGYAPLYQWQTGTGGSFTDVPGANAAAFTSARIPSGQNGLKVRALVFVPGRTLVSSVATITLTADGAAPVLLSAASANGTQVGVRFSEPVTDVSATDTNNYLINGLAPLTAAIRDGGTKVQLTAAAPVGKEFTVTVSNIQDRAVAGSVLTNASIIGKFWLEDVVDINGPSPVGQHFTAEEGQVEIAAGGGDVWGTSDQFTFAYMPRTNDFDIKVRIDSLAYAGNDWAKAGMNVRESTNNNSRMVWFYPTPTEGAGQFEGAIRFNNGGDVTDFGQPRPAVSFPAWLRLVRSGASFTAFLSKDGTNWNMFGSTQNAPAFPAKLLVGVGAVSHNNGTATTAQFAEFGDNHPLLVTSVSGNQMTIRWDGKGVLQYADSIGGAWQNVEGAASPFTVTCDQAHRYYRVQRLFPNAP